MIAAWAKELLAVQDRIDQENRKLDEAKKQTKATVRALSERAEHLRNLIRGREGEQIELPVLGRFA
jgi:hypothetical protein